MDKDKAIDYGATFTGGTLGLDQVFQSIDSLVTDGATGQEWVALAKGLLLIVFGYFTWKRTKDSKAVGL
jgi:hypothetical protein